MHLLTTLFRAIFINIILLSTATAQGTDFKGQKANLEVVQKEIQQASEAAPLHITEHASFMTFTNGEFRLIKSGSNDFTCLVVREPNGRYEPACFNQPAMNSVFYTYQMHMKLMYMGYDAKQTYQKLALAFEGGQLPLPETASLVYMMSPNNETYDQHKKVLKKGMRHHMYFYPKLAYNTFSLAPQGPSLWQGFPAMSALIVKVH